MKLRMALRFINQHFLFLLLLVVAVILYVLIPIPGVVQYRSQPQQNAWPRVTFERVWKAVTNSDMLDIYVEDITPWVYVRLETDEFAAGTLIEHGGFSEEQVWLWHWSIPWDDDITWLELYHSCHEGCQHWSTLYLRATPPEIELPPVRVPTKLCVVLPNPDRNWHGRQGWVVEITYAALAEGEFWGIHDLVRRVQRHIRNGLLVLVRVEYQQGQSIPPRNNVLQLEQYLRYARQLARDERLRGIYGYIIGSNFNTAASNSLAAGQYVTPEWYARVFNGYGVEPSLTNNAIQVIKNANPNINVLVGPVSAWNTDQDGREQFRINTPWLNYMNSILAYINESATTKSALGIDGAAPDGFAVQAFGRINHADVPAEEAFLEPRLSLRHNEWEAAQAGFQIYTDWLQIINSYPYTSGKPVFISATNTFDGTQSSVPAENYPPGWLTEAAHVIDQEPQIRSLCWFMDYFARDTQWSMFSLTDQPGQLAHAADEFELLLTQ